MGESNPDVLTGFCRKVGMPTDWSFVDVLGLDAELVEMVPKPSLACVLLFPCTRAIYAGRRQEANALRQGGNDGRAGRPSGADMQDLFFLEQVPEFGNACGTIAAMHVMMNAFDRLPDGVASADFRQKYRQASPAERGAALVSNPAFQEASDASAQDEVHTQTVCPGRDAEPLDHHFVGFVRSKTGRLIELDGTKPSPIDHGPCASHDNLVAQVAGVVQERFVALSPEEHGFSLVAL